LRGFCGVEDLNSETKDVQDTIVDRHNVVFLDGCSTSDRESHSMPYPQLIVGSEDKDHDSARRLFNRRGFEDAHGD
jgi:hypothetical protein